MESALLHHLLPFSFAVATALSVCAPPDASAQSVSFEEDLAQRGYYDRPWLRYEAEPYRCVSNAEFLLPPVPYSQLPLQSEASNLSAVMLREKEDFVEWTVDAPGRGLSLRFSLPDAENGGGLKGELILSVDGRERARLNLDSHWAWQYTRIAYSPEKYPDNVPSAEKFARMRFDETYLLLDEDIPAGATLRLSKAEDDGLDYCIDFIELEAVAPPIPFESIDSSDKVCYDGSTGLGAFISANPGKTIYIPAGTYQLERQLHITAPGTRITGAGLWHTRLYFSTPSDTRNGYNARGVHCNVSGVVLENLSIDTANDKRYYDNNPAYQVGKGLNGSWGSDSRVSNVRIDHFECGGWIQGARRLTVEHCRFRNNYADGINFANNSSECRLSHCHFRNNGDDDMASWSTGDFASDNEFSYSTAENNWRASSLGFFGGRRGCAHHLAIYDAMEAGARVVCDFDGTGFSREGYFELSDITIRRSGAKQGLSGTQGGFWGDSAAALQIGAGWAYDLNNLRVRDIDILDSRFDAISIKCQSGKSVNNLELSDIRIHGVDDYRYGVGIDPGVRGNGCYCNIVATDVTEPFMSTIPTAFRFESISGIDSPCVSPCDNHSDTPLLLDLSGCRLRSAADAPICIVSHRGCTSLKLRP